MVVADERLRGPQGVADVDTEEGDALGVGLRIHLDQPGGFRPARRAPRRPHVDDHDRAPQCGEVSMAALDRRPSQSGRGFTLGRQDDGGGALPRNEPHASRRQIDRGAVGATGENHDSQHHHRRQSEGRPTTHASTMPDSCRCRCRAERAVTTVAQAARRGVEAG